MLTNAEKHDRATALADSRQREKIERLEADNSHLLAALKALSAMYASTWDRADGGLMMMDSGVERFEKAHKLAYDTIAKIEGRQLAK